jgi:hypothetical protein
VDAAPRAANAGRAERSDGRPNFLDAGGACSLPSVTVAWSRKRVRSEFASFLREYQRTSRRPGLDPNDRHYDRKLERRIKRMSPEELDRLMRDAEDDLD